MRPLLLFGFNLKREFRIDIPTVVAGAVRKLGIAALGAADVMNGLERLMRTAFALARLADSLNRKHDRPRYK